MTQPESSISQTRDVVPFRVATKAWIASSLRTFGGPAGQIAVMHRSLVASAAVGSPVTSMAQSSSICADLWPVLVGVENNTMIVLWCAPCV